MRHLIIILITFISTSAFATNDPMCTNVSVEVANILNKVDGAPVTTTVASAVAAPATDVAEAYQAFGAKVRDVTNPSEVNRLMDDASNIQIRGSRALASSDPAQMAKAKAAIDGKLAEINEAATLPGNADKVTWLNRSKSELLQTKYFSDPKFRKMSAEERIKALSVDELKAIQADLRAVKGMPSYGKPEANLAAEGELLAAIEKDLNKRPEVLADQQRRLAAAGAEFRAGQSNAELAARNASPNVAARPLSTAQTSEMEQFGEILKRNPDSLTPAQVKRLQELRAEVAAKSNYKEGSRSGMMPADEARTTAFVNAWDSAADNLRRRAQSMQSLAESQGRAYRTATVQSNRVDNWGNQSRPTLTSTQAERMRAPDADKIMTDLNRVSPGNSRLENVVAYKPVVARVEDMAKLNESLSAIGVTRDQLNAVNVISTLDVTSVDHAVGQLEQARQFLTQMEAASKSGQLNGMTERLGPNGVQLVRQMIETTKFHVQHYVPPHLRLERFNNP